MAIKLDTFSSPGGGAGSDNLDDVTTRGATTTNSITVGGVTIGTEYSLPLTDASSANQFIKSDGAGTLSFAALDITGGLVYKGAFNATAGTPSLTNAKQGDFYIIDTAGTIYGQTWVVGDHLLINEDMGGTITNSKIDKVDNTDQVTSVNGNTGAVVLSGDDLAADHTASNYTAANANIDGHFSGIDTKLGTLGTSAFLDVGTTASKVVQLNGSAKLPAVDGSLLTNLPSAPVTSVNTATGAVVLSGDDIAADHTASNYTAADANVDGHFSGIDTKLGTLGTSAFLDVGTTASKVVQLNGSAKLPAVDGSLLTNLPSAPVTSVNTATGAVVLSGDDIAADHTASNYTAADANVDGHFSGIDTKLGTLGTSAFLDVGTTASKVVQLNGSAKLPAVDGSLLTNLPSAPVTSVNTATGAVVLSGDDIAADHTASNYTAADANVDGHFSGIDTKLGTLGTAAFIDVGTTASKVVQLDGSAKLPAVDGSQLINLPSAPVTSVNGSTGAVTVEVSDDSSPQLGGDLDTNQHEIVTTSNRNLILRPNGTGAIQLGGNTNPAELRLYCESSDAHYVALKSPTHSELSGGSVTWRLPTADATTPGDALVSDGSGNLSFTTISGGGSAPTVTTEDLSSSGNYTITTNTGIREIFAFTSSANRVINLPTTSTVGEGYQYDIKSLSNVTFTITCSGSDTIDDGSSTTFDLTDQYSSLTLVADSDNNRWFIV